MTSETVPSRAPASSSRSRLGALWEAIIQDLRYAVRGLRKKPGFSLGVIVTLALGIGANATMFGVIDRLLLKPPAFLADAATTHRIYLAQSYQNKEHFGANMAYRRYRQLGEFTSSFARTAAFFTSDVAVGRGDDARERKIGMVSASFWRMFTIRPVIGRFFAADEDKAPAGTPVAVLGYGYWQSKFGGKSDVIGQVIQLGSKPFTIIGVAPRGFSGMSLETPAMFIPITAGAAELFGEEWSSEFYDTFNINWMEMIAQRKPGVSLDAATADLTQAFRRSYQDQLALQPRSAPIAESRPHGVVGSILAERGPNRSTNSKVATWLAGVSAIVLLIACANVANLLLARALRRRREIAVRVALGVGRSRLIGQLVTESVLLALAGALGGLAIAQWGGGVLRAAFLPNVEFTGSIVDPRMLLFATAAALLVGLITGLAPALQSSRPNLALALKAGSREGTYHRSHLRTALLVLQGALSVVLLTGAGLFVRSLHNVDAVRLGYDAEHLLYVGAEMRGIKLDTASAVALDQRLIEGARAIPGVINASATVTVPFWRSMNEDLYVAGIDSVSKLGDFYLNAGSPSYFATMGTRLVRGRAFTDADRAGAPRVMDVSESMARKLWPGTEAIGKCVKVGADTVPCTEVIGVVEDIRRGSLSDDPGLQYYLPIAQFNREHGGLFVRTSAPATTQVETIRRELQKLMPGTSYVNVTSLHEIVDPNFRPFKLGATMFSIFGSLALLLAAVGLYSVIAYTVQQRMHEMGVRVALGAQSGDVVRLILSEGLRVSLIGLGIGVAIALIASRYVAQLLFNVSPRDPVVLGVVSATLLTVAIVACVLPARRAARVDPNVALRAE